MELLRARTAHMQSYGITTNDAQMTLVLLTNIEHAKNEDYGREFRPYLQNICRTFSYNHVHDVALLTAILKELAVADGVRAMRDAPGPSGTGRKNIANESNEEQ